MANHRTLWAICITCMTEFEGYQCFGRADRHAKDESTRPEATKLHYILKYVDGRWANPSGHERRLALQQNFDPDVPHHPRRQPPPGITFAAGCLNCARTGWSGKGAHLAAALHARANRHDAWKYRSSADGEILTFISYNLQEELPFALQRWEKDQWT